MPDFVEQAADPDFLERVADPTPRTRM